MCILVEKKIQRILLKKKMKWSQPATASTSFLSLHCEDPEPRAEDIFTVSERILLISISQVSTSGVIHVKSQFSLLRKRKHWKGTTMLCSIIQRQIQIGSITKQELLRLKDITQLSVNYPPSTPTLNPIFNGLYVSIQLNQVSKKPRSMNKQNYLETTEVIVE